MLKCDTAAAARTNTWTDRREGGNIGLDYGTKTQNINENVILGMFIQDRIFIRFE